MKGSHRSWDEYFPHIDFAYNRVVHKTTNISPFEVVYGFNPLTPLDLLPLPNPHTFVHKEGATKAGFVKKMHERVKEQIQHQKREIIFEEGDLVWLHLRKDRFPTKRKSKLSPRGDRPFQVLKRINNNAYKLDLPVEHGVHDTFNVIDLTSFVGNNEEDEEEALDLRTNHFQEREDDGRGPSKAHIKAHQRVDFGQPLVPWPRGSKKTGMLLLMAKKPSYTCSKCHKL